MDSKPLTVSRANVNVHRAEIIILLVTFEQAYEHKYMDINHKPNNMHISFV